MSSKRKPQSSRHEHEMWICAGGGKGVLIPGQTHLSVTMNLKVWESYRGALQFHRPSSAQFSHNSEPQRRCPRPRYFHWREDRKEHTEVSLYQVILLNIYITSHILSDCLSLLLHWRWTMETQVMLCHSASINRKKRRGWGLKTDCYHIILTQYIAQFCWIS